MTNANVVTNSGRSMLNYRLEGNGTQPVNVGWGTGGSAGTDTGSAVTDVNLFSAPTTSPEARTAGAASLLQSAANKLADTYQVIGTITATASRAITEVGLFDTATSLSAMATIATLTAGATSGVIGSTITAAFPSAGNYYAQIENEVVLVTGGQGTSTLTFTRGALATSAAAHVAGSVITAGGDGGAYLANNSTSGSTWNGAGANGGAMMVHADFAVINLSTNDSIQFTLKVQLS